MASCVPRRDAASSPPPRHPRTARVRRALELGDRPGHAAGQARPQHRALRVEQAAFHVGARHRSGGAGAAQRNQFVGQQVFQALAAGCEEFQSDLIGLLRSMRRNDVKDSRAIGERRCTRLHVADRRCESSTSSRRARARRPSRPPATAGISSSCQPWMIEIGTAAPAAPGQWPIAIGGAIRNRPAVGTCSDTCPEIHAPRLEPASTSGPRVAACCARSTQALQSRRTSPSSLTSRLASRSV
jgi:hypothetical protein